METAEILEEIVVADAENVRFTESDDGLHVSFDHWDGTQISIFFRDIRAFKWDPHTYEYLPGERYDSAHIIHNSEWIKKLIANNEATSGDDLTHYRFNFNASNVLEVLAAELEVRH